MNGDTIRPQNVTLNADLAVDAATARRAAVVVAAAARDAADAARLLAMLGLLDDTGLTAPAAVPVALQPRRISAHVVRSRDV